MNKSRYTMMTTSGEEVYYSQKEMLDIVRQYLTKKYPNRDITESDCLDEVDDFVSRFKLVDNNN